MIETINWIPMEYDWEYSEIDNEDYFVFMCELPDLSISDEMVLITTESGNVEMVEFDGYYFGDYCPTEILAWASLPKAYEKGQEVLR